MYISYATYIFNHDQLCENSIFNYINLVIFQFFHSFEDHNAEKLQRAMTGVASMDKGYNFDPRSIDCKNYIMNILFPGLMKYSMQAKM